MENNDLQIIATYTENAIKFYNSKASKLILKSLDQPIKEAFLKRIGYFDLDKSRAKEVLAKFISFNHLTIFKEPITSDQYAIVYNDHKFNYACYHVNQAASDFINYRYYLEGLDKSAKSTDIDFVKIYDFAKSKGDSFIFKGYPFDLLVHDCNIIAERKRENDIKGFFWICNVKYLSTHIMNKHECGKHIKSMGGEYHVYSFDSKKFITL